MDLKEATNRISAQAELVSRIRDEVSKVIVGQEKLVDRLILAMVTGGHILLEGVPGLAKKIPLTKNIVNWTDVDPVPGYSVRTTIDIQLQEIVERGMQEAYSGRVKLTASCGVGENWLEAH